MSPGETVFPVSWQLPKYYFCRANGTWRLRTSSKRPKEALGSFQKPSGSLRAIILVCSPASSSLQTIFSCIQNIIFAERTALDALEQAPGGQEGSGKLAKSAPGASKLLFCRANRLLKASEPIFPCIRRPMAAHRRSHKPSLSVEEHSGEPPSRYF